MYSSLVQVVSLRWLHTNVRWQMIFLGKFTSHHARLTSVSHCQKCRQKGSFKRDAVLHTHAVDAMDHHAVAELIRKTNTDIVINVGSPFINMSVMDACIETGTHYLDTAIYEDPIKFAKRRLGMKIMNGKTRSPQKAGATAILGVGIDPGVVNAYARLGVEYFDKDSVTRY